MVIWISLAAIVLSICMVAVTLAVALYLTHPPDDPPRVERCREEPADGDAER